MQRSKWNMFDKIAKVETDKAGKRMRIAAGRQESQAVGVESHDI